MKYIALLRGINVGGNNKVSMISLKQSFESFGFENVQTYINSGNVIFDTAAKSLVQLTKDCETVIEQTFGFSVVCAVVTASDLQTALLHAPEWWGLDDDDKHNALFVIAPKTAEQIMQEVGAAKPEYEKVAFYGSVIFWTAPLSTFGHTRYSKIVGTAAYKSITIRGAKTIKKLVELSQLS